MAGYLQEGHAEPQRKAVTLPALQNMKKAGEKIAMLTCYDASFAALMDACAVDMLLVGDSLGNVLQGHATTLLVTIDDIAYHTVCVARGNKSALLASDMPFGSYGTPESVGENAAKLIRAGAQLVKLEGGAWLCDTVRFLTERSIPVFALGLTPQSVHQLGGFGSGKSAAGAERLMADALALQQAGASMFLEAIPASVGKSVSEALSIPTVGIGAGPGVGQVLVMHDMLGCFRKEGTFCP